jgi:hypothetical protein
MILDVPFYISPNIYVVDVSMPNALTETDDPEVYTTSNFPAFIISPVLSNTPFGSMVTSYSIYSAAVGVANVDNAILTVHADVPLFKTLTENTVKVFGGTVYTVVFVIALSAAWPNKPVAMLVFLR